MKAIRFERYGGAEVMELREVEKPRVEDGGVLVRIRAASVNPIDWHFMTGLPHIGRVAFGMLRPKVSGLAGLRPSRAP